MSRMMKLISVDSIPPLNIIAQDITNNVHEEWICKNLLYDIILSMKNEMLNTIGVANWAPTNQSLCITSYLPILMYQIGNKVGFDFRGMFLIKF